MRLIVVVLFFAAIGSLAYAASGLLRSKADSSAQLQRAFRLRIGLSIAIFLFLLLAWQLGLIEPHGLGG